jgi:ribosomal-protein-alanine N-acetyltransferase
MMVSRQALSPVTLRAVTPSDVAAIAAIEERAFTDPWPASAFLDLLDRPHARLMAAFDANGSLCGYCVLLHVLDEGEIANIAVAPERRRRGIAARLLDDALSAARTMGLAAIFLEVRMSNDAARNLYQSRGFEPVGRRRAYYREPLEDALVLRWERPTDA